MTDDDSLRARLRGLPAFGPDRGNFDPNLAPEAPHPLFVDWLDEAITAGVTAPHAMTLSTSGAERETTARVLILKDVGAEGWQFATDAGSPKAQAIAQNPRVALSFFWPAIGRQVRITGSASALSEAAAAADFLARPEGSRAATLVGHQSETLASREEYARTFERALARVRSDPELVSPSWTVYSVRADEVEFWQASDDRGHTRLRYRREAERWSRQLLWP